VFVGVNGNVFNGVNVINLLGQRNRRVTRDPLSFAPRDYPLTDSFQGVSVRVALTSHPFGVCTMKSMAFYKYVAQREELERLKVPQCDHCNDTGVNVSKATGLNEGITCAYCHTGILLLESAQ